MQFMCYLLLNYAGVFHLGTSSPTTMKQPCSNALGPPPPLASARMIRVHWMSKLSFYTLLCIGISVQLTTIDN